jgi:preprotein translocase subunit YajC
MDHLYNFCFFLLAQSQTVPIEGAAKDAADAAADAGQGGLFGLGYFLPAMLAVMVVYFIMMSRPQKKEAQSRERLKDLKKNDRVVTAGGILGTVVNVRPDTEYTTIRIDDSANTKMQVMTQSIVRILSDESAESGASEKSK